jgi:hypothetical protein
MFRLRFNQVFVALLFASFVAAFVLPANLTDPARNLQKLFAPVAWPARAIASAVRNRVAPPQRPEDNRDVADVKAENEQLTTMVLSLTGQLEEMRRINEERAKLGNVRDMCTRFRVVGTDPSLNRDSLGIVASTADNVRARMPVLYGDGVVGRIDRVNPGGAQVQLITDKEFQATARFFRKPPGAAIVEVKTRQPLIRGAGNGRMIIVNVPLKETKGPPPEQGEIGVEVGDIVVIDDPEWPLQGRWQKLGTIEAIEAQQGARLYALIRVKPALPLGTLDEVMVMNKVSTDEGSANAQ